MYYDFISLALVKNSLFKEDTYFQFVQSKVSQGCFFLNTPPMVFNDLGKNGRTLKAYITFGENWFLKIKEEMGGEKKRFLLFQPLKLAKANFV